MPKKLDIAGQKFGRLTAMFISWAEPNSGRTIWLCRCDCGKTKNVKWHNLTSWRSQSCGCAGIWKNMTHWMSWTSIYKVWVAIKDRCDNIDNYAYDRYGWRWITYDASWGKFENFYRDMGYSYRDGLQIDRVENEEWYSKHNCRWSTPMENANNRWRTTFIETENWCIPLTVAAETNGIKEGTLRNRLATGMSHSEALSKPVGNNIGSSVQALKDGVMIKEFRTMSMAWEWCNAGVSEIHNCCHGKRATAKGYSWRFSDPSKRKTFVPKDGPARKVKKFSMDWTFITEYDTMTLAGESVGVTDITNISKCCKGKGCKSAYGYVWRFSDDDTLPTEKRVSMYKDWVLVKEFNSIASAASFLWLPKTTLIVKHLNGNCTHVLWNTFQYV